MSGDEPQDEKLVGVVVRDTLEELAFAWRTIPVESGLHVKESIALPVPSLTVIVTGLVAQVALGILEEENPTAAYAATMTTLMERPTKICGRYSLTGDSNCTVGFRLP